MQTITPFLWFDDQAEEAMHFYASIFKDSTIGDVSRGADGRAFTVSFTLNGQNFMGLNGGPKFGFTEATSFFVNCETQAEIDDLWEKLSAGGDPNAQQCGWLKDKFGLSWQIIPSVLGDLLGGPDPVKSQKAMNAMLQMQKLDIAALKKAYDG